MNQKQNSRIPVLVIFAPTATGKTEIVGRLFSDNASSFFAGKAEVISADSMQIYKNLNIGTAKSSAEFLSHLPHHLIDVCEIDQSFGVGRFIDLADQAANQIYEKGKLPVFCGGSSFYVRNFIYGLPLTPESRPEVRALIQNRMQTEGNQALFNELCTIDPDYAKKINVNDKYRIARALEVYYSCNLKLSTFSVSSKPREKYDFCTIYLTRKREELYERINERVIKMFQEGLETEVQGLLEQDYTKECSGMSAIGYREFFTSGEDPNEMFEMAKQNPEFKQSPRYLCWISEVKRQIQRNTRHYAKKQITFFEPICKLQGNFANIHKVESQDFAQIEKIIMEFYQSHF